MVWLGLAAVVLVQLIVGCASRPVGSGGEAAVGMGGRRFEFAADTVGFTNETRWIYEWDAEGGPMRHYRRVPPPTYSLRCFVVSRLNRQFFDHATFAPDAPRPGVREIERRVREVVRRSARRPSSPDRRVVIPGYRNLRELSVACPEILQRCGGHGYESYVQRGHWRMVFPFGRVHQRRTAEALWQGVSEGRPRVVHLVVFPALTLNHGVLVFAGRRTASGFEFDAADPNEPGRPRLLTYDSATGRFRWPPTPYFSGGPVDAYEVYQGLWY